MWAKFGRGSRIGFKKSNPPCAYKPRQLPGNLGDTRAVGENQKPFAGKYIPRGSLYSQFSRNVLFRSNMKSNLVPGHHTPAPFTTAEVVTLSGVSARMVQYYDEMRIVSPTSKAFHRRLYTLEEAASISVIGRLREQGMSLQVIRGVLPLVLQTDFALRDGCYLLTNGNGTVLLLASKTAVFAAMKKFTRGAYLIVIDDHIQPFLSYKRKPEE